MTKMLGKTGYWRRCSCLDCGSRNHRRMRAREKSAHRSEVSGYLGRRAPAEYTRMQTDIRGVTA